MVDIERDDRWGHMVEGDRRVIHTGLSMAICLCAGFQGARLDDSL